MPVYMINSYDQTIGALMPINVISIFLKKTKLVSLRSRTDPFSDRKEVSRTMEIKLEDTVNCFQFVDCTLDAEN